MSFIARVWHANAKLKSEKNRDTGFYSEVTRFRMKLKEDYLHESAEYYTTI